MAYVDGFLVPVPLANVRTYRKLARRAGRIWMEYGALQYVEAVAEDIAMDGLVSFPKAVQAGPDEVVLFSWILYRSRARRQRVNAQVLADPRIASMGPDRMPFQPSRMLHGGFKPIVKF